MWWWLLDKEHRTNGFVLKKVFCVHKSRLFSLREKRKSLMCIKTIYTKDGTTLTPSEQQRLENTEVSFLHLRWSPSRRKSKRLKSKSRRSCSSSMIRHSTQKCMSLFTKRTSRLQYDWFPLMDNLLKEWTKDQIKKNLYIPVDNDFEKIKKFRQEGFVFSYLSALCDDNDYWRLFLSAKSLCLNETKNKKQSYRRHKQRIEIWTDQ